MAIDYYARYHSPKTNLVYQTFVHTFVNVRGFEKYTNFDKNLGRDMFFNTTFYTLIINLQRYPI